jgi:hypothetical protein|tara:strand:- start:75 stop:482 length:408 start_codon:yes stop_codon:yes gene_type:complete
MAIAKGYEAVVKVGSDTLGQVTDFSFNKTVDSVETSSIGTTSKSFVNTLESWSGSVNLFFDDADTAGAALLTACAGGGASVTVSFYVEGTASGVDKYYTGTCLVSSLDWSESANGLLTASVSLTGTGALSQATAS